MTDPVTRPLTIESVVERMDKVSKQLNVCIARAAAEAGHSLADVIVDAAWNLDQLINDIQEAFDV